MDSKTPILLLALVVISTDCVNSRSISNGENATTLTSAYAKVAHWGSSRSLSQGQKPWTQRLEANINYGQNLKNHRSYDTSDIPAEGEVRERFNPRPYFVYGSSANSHSDNIKSPVYSAPNTPSPLPVPVLPTIAPQPHEDSYESPYSSYNPPKPNEPTDYQPPKEQEMKNHDDYLPQEEHDNELPSSSINNGNGNEIADNVQENEQHPSFYSEDGNDQHGLKELILDHPPPGYKSKEPDMAPPPSPEHFPHYLYDDAHHSDHHVYHEIEKPNEEKRVSKPQYSYYYIGRKLWYIPLYFSVYFIIYVTFLILKSIARHKIHFKHEFLEHHSRQSRQLSNDNIDKIHRNVSSALLLGQEKYRNVAM